MRAPLPTGPMDSARHPPDARAPVATPRAGKPVPGCPNGRRHEPV
ncbi:hypothetical protein I35_0597 [Burkholderia cenocepacia H111]|nr:hypothetical protein I35_0597 [Burkholderia cenocepacia H111]